MATFKVAPVELSTEKLEEGTLQHCIEKIQKTWVKKCAESDGIPIEFEVCEAQFHFKWIRSCRSEWIQLDVFV